MKKDEHVEFKCCVKKARSGKFTFSWTDQVH